MRIKKTSATTPTQAQVINTKSSSTSDSYSANFVNGLVEDTYSTSETLTNKVWIDNKPIYRKCFTINSLGNNQTISIQHNINNISHLTHSELSWYDSDDQRYRIAPRIDSNTVKIIFSGINTIYAYIECIGSDWSLRTNNVCLVLEYTKTTD